MPLYAGEASSSVLCPDVESSVQEDVDLLKCIQRRATEMIQGMEHLSCENRLRELGLFSLEERRLQGDLSVFKGGLQERRGQTL